MKNIFTVCAALSPCLCFALLYPAQQACCQHVQLIVQHGTTFSVGNSSLVLNNTDIKSAGAFNAANGNLAFTGDAGSSAAFASTPAIKKITLAKTGNATLTLNSDVNVNNSVVFQSGLIDLNGNTVNLGTTGSLQNESEHARITGVTGGSVKASAASISHPSAANIGNLGAEITSSANPGKVEVSRMHKPTQNPNDNTKTGIGRTFLFVPENNNALQATLRFHYFDAELNGKDENTLTLWTSPDGVTWTVKDITARNISDNYVETTGLNSLAYYTLSDAGNPLPVILSEFKVFCQNNYALIEWKTATESGITGFEVQKRTDNTGWETIQTVQNTGRLSGDAYSYKDENPQPGAYYRLKTIDQSGQVSFSAISGGDCAAAAMPLVVYPNPAKANATAQISVRQTANATLDVYDIAGRRLYSDAWKLQTGMNKHLLPVQPFAAGVYIVKVFVNNISYQAKLIKQ